MEINDTYLKLLMSKQINRIEFFMLCCKNWPTKEYCLKRFGIKKTAYYRYLSNAKRHSTKSGQAKIAPNKS